MGASIYCVLFMIECNFDYKLIFLIFCVLYLRIIKNKFQKYFALITILLSSNYLIELDLSKKIFNEQLYGVGLNLIFKCIVLIILLNLLIKYFLNLYKDHGIKKNIFLIIIFL